MAAETSSGNDGVTMRACPLCGAAFPPSGRRRHCSDKCRVAAWRRRHLSVLTPAPIPAKEAKRPVTVYECGSCGERALGEQYCEACHRFMRAVGIGGCCAACDEPLTVEELLGGGAL